MPMVVEREREQVGACSGLLHVHGHRGALCTWMDRLSWASDHFSDSATAPTRWSVEGIVQAASIFSGKLDSLKRSCATTNFSSGRHKMPTERRCRERWVNMGIRWSCSVCWCGDPWQMKYSCGRIRDSPSSPLTRLEVSLKSRRLRCAATISHEEPAFGPLQVEAGDGRGAEDAEGDGEGAVVGADAFGPEGRGPVVREGRIFVPAEHEGSSIIHSMGAAAMDVEAVWLLN
ncbi:hypothetical protein ZWY2020_056672 [Hordeum vulgare]|nr:hypothetical protein ZWY2020_056672 [Hordeum vulgare]